MTRRSATCDSPGARPERVDLVERYAKTQGLWREPGDGPTFDELLELDLASIEPSVAGPRRPQDRVPLTDLRDNFRTNFPHGLDAPIGSLQADAPVPGDGAVEDASAASFPASDPTSFAAADHEGTPPADPIVVGSPPVDGGAYRPIPIEVGGQAVTIRTGSVAIAAITSCTNTSNPTVMVGAGLLARNAVARGLRVGPTVKTSLAPGSRAVTGYLEAAGLMEPLETLGFALAGYGCTTCIGNSGPLDDAVAAAVEANDLVVAAVLSGNRNFEGRIHPLARASYLASPPLVVAFALAGRADIDLTTEPLGTGTRRPAGLPRRHLAGARRDPLGHRRRDRSGALHPDLRDGLRGRRSLARPADPGRRPLRSGRTTRRTSPSRRSSRVSRSSRGPSPTSPTPASSPSSAIRSRPTISRQPARSPRRRPPASGSRRTASVRSSSTRTARGAATTR